MKKGVRILRSVGFVFALISMLAFGAIIALGQAIDGNIVGTVTDASGAAVVGADVTATNIGTNVAANAKTGGSGEYRFEHLLAGEYRITVRMTGFKTVSENVMVELNKTGTRNISLAPGAATETVEVSGTPPTIDTTTAQLQNTFDSRTVSDSPMASTGSGVINLSLLDAGVATQGGIGLGTGPSVSGQRPRNNNYTVEGVDNNSKTITGPLLQLPNDAVDQFTVLQNQFSSEFGHSSGGQFNQTIKSGTNNFHGRIYEYFQNRNMNAIDSQLALSEASNNLPISNTPYDNNRYGGQIGGPIIKNKLFFFTNWEYNTIKNYQFSTGCAPTAAGYTTMAGDSAVNATNVAQYQKYVGTAGKQASASDPNCGDVNDNSGLSTTPVGSNLIPLGAVGFAGGWYENFLTGVTSIDWNISDKDQVRGRYAYEKNDNIDFNGQIPAFWTINPDRFHVFTFSEYHNFSPNLTNEVRVGYNRFYQNFPDGGFSFPGLGTFPNLLVGIGEVNGGPQLGADPNAPQFTIQNFYQIVDNVSWIKANHTFKFGGEYAWYITPQGFTQRKRGDYDYLTFDGYFTDQVPDYLAERSMGNVTYYGNQKMLYWWANDDWKIKKNFTLNLGLRYEYTQVPLSQRQWQPLNAISNVPGLVTFGAPQAQKTNFLPRVGFAWSPGSSGTTSIRGGFSMATDVLYDNLGVLSAPPQVQQTCDAFAGATQAAPGSLCTWNDPGTNGTGFLAGGGLPTITTIPAITDPAVARASTGGFIPDQKLPYSETWTLGVQHIFANKYTVEVRYVGTRGIHLPVQSRLNRQAKTSPTMFLPTYLQNPGQGALDALTVTADQIGANSSFVPAWDNAGFNGSNVVGFMPYGGSKYNGLQTQVSRSFTNGLQFQAAWTWSHNMDNSTADVFSTYITPRRPQDFQCFACDWSDSALDRRHRVTLQATYDLPFLKHSDNWVKKNVIGNWQVSPVYTFQSPEYGTVQSGGDVNGNGDSAGDRVIINPAGKRGTGSDVTALTNTAGDTVAYLAVDPNAYYISAGQFARPNARRNTLALPHINNFDFSILKRVNITEHKSFEFSAQALNMFNHAQYVPGFISDAAPGTGFNASSILAMLIPSTSGFNQPKAVFTNHPRQLVLVAKFNF
jgi:Carboxypeptidase regulatory-like domain